MKRRDFLKIGLFSTLAAAGGIASLKIYRHITGVRKIFDLEGAMPLGTFTLLLFFAKFPHLWMLLMTKLYY